MSRTSRIVALWSLGALIGTPTILVAQTGPPGPCCCPGDLDGSGFVDDADAELLAQLFGPCPPDVGCPADLDGNEVVDDADLGVLIAQAGPCCPGDLDVDGRVGEPDVTIFTSCLFGQLCPPDPCCPHDFNKDGRVDEADAEILGANFGPCSAGCPCPWDLDDDGIVGPADLTAVLASAGICCPGDLNGNRIINDVDVELLGDLFGPCPPPPALCPGDLTADGLVDLDDLTRLIALVGTACCRGDLNTDGRVDGRDGELVQEALGPCPGDPCPEDLDGDGIVTTRDLGILLGVSDTCCPGDLNTDGIRDVTDLTDILGRFGVCCADTNGNFVVEFADLVTVLASWGPYAPCPPYLPADFDQSCSVDFADLVTVLSGWGPCTCP